MKTRILLHKGFKGDSLALIAGMLLTLAFAPFKLFPLAILSPAILLATWLNVSAKQAFLRGWYFGIGLFSTGVYWIFISIHTYGNTSVFLAGFITIGFIALMALYPALNGYLLNRYFPKTNNTKILCAFPVIWVFLEWIRSWLFTGFPWLLIGTSQINSPLKGYAAVLGVYGVSLAVVFSSSLIISLIRQFKIKELIALIAIWLLGLALCFISWTKPFGDPLQVSLIQGNIGQELKWQPEQVQPTLDIYTKLTEENWASPLIIWPEAAIPLPFLSAMDFLMQLDAEAKKHHSTIITGIPMRIPNTQDYLNTLITLGVGKGIYAKHRLVPFGEYVPFQKFFGRLLTFMDIPMSQFVPAQEAPQPIQVNGLKIAAFICYEIAYPEQVLSRDGKVNLLLTVSNDAWFGESIAQAQHLEMAQMRALEMGRPVLFGSNTGLTAIVDVNGNIQTSIAPYQRAVLTDKVQGTQGKTPWQRFSMDPVLAIMLGMLFVAIRKQKP